MTPRNQPPVITQRLTCEFCAHLRQLRPMCMSETSPNYRMVRDSYQDRCQSYAVPGKIHKPQTEQQTGTRP
jgi:hypothetical protein